MGEHENIHKVLSDVRVTVGRIDGRLKGVLDTQREQGEDIEKLKTQRSLIAGAYFALVAAFTAWIGFKE